MRTRLTFLLLTGACTALLAFTSIGATQGPGGAIAMDGDDIAGVVTGPKGPEAGVWVIAETTDLPTKFSRTVVTDDQGRYLIPDLPKASYQVWVRGYGLVDSPKSTATPGARLALEAVVAPTPQAAAHYYPAGFWYSLLEIPAEREFPGTGGTGNGIQPAITSQQQYLRVVKSGGCTTCHQLGTIGTREIPKDLGHFNSSLDAWQRRIASGQAGGAMVGTINQVGLRMQQEFANWTDRIKAGAVPPAPPRPQGLERNVVITQWDWADPKHYLHDEV